MMKLYYIKIVFFVSLMSLSCAKNKKLNSPLHAHKGHQVVPNEFVFMGDRDGVVKYLDQHKINHEIIVLDEYRDLYHVISGDNINYEEIEKDLKARLNFIEPNFMVYKTSPTPTPIDISKWPKDKYFFNQWAINNVGQSAPGGLEGKKNADINVLKLWEQGVVGSEEIIIGIIDTGVDYKHPDFKHLGTNKTNIFLNSKEANGLNGVDDDGNGFVDDLFGWNFVSTYTTNMFYGKPGNNDPMDDDGHGTHCAGVIGAVPNNLIGVAGINWNVSILPIKALCSEGSGSSTDLYRAIKYGVLMKVDVLSNSWGSSSKSELVELAIKEANDAGIVFVVASGNDGVNNDVKPTYPANYGIPNIITVGASDNLDAPAEFSNYGQTSVDVFAPGVMILSTLPSVDGEGRYGIASGTSMACPHVSGIIALMLSANPNLRGNPQKIKEILINTSDVNPKLIGKSRSNGRVNAYKAVTVGLDYEKSPRLETIVKNRSFRGISFPQELIDHRQVIRQEGAASIRVHFNFVQIDEPFDSIWLYDKDYNFISAVEKNQTTSFWSPMIPGDTIIVRQVNSKVRQTSMGSKVEFVSFNSEGYHIDKIEYVVKPNETGGSQ